jgi:hypothetical protein
MDGATRPLAAVAYATSARRLRWRSKPKSRSSLHSASRSTTAVRQAMAGMRQKQIRGCEIPPHRRRHQWPDAMLRRHSLLNLRSVDPEDGSFRGSHGHSLLRSSAHNIQSEAVVIESDPNAKSRATHEPAGLRQTKRSFHENSARSSAWTWATSATPWGLARGPRRAPPDRGRHVWRPSVARIQSGDGRGARPGLASADRLDRGLQVRRSIRRPPAALRGFQWRRDSLAGHALCSKSFRVTP